jgi:hypothetical protein
MNDGARFIVADPGLTGPEGHHLHYSEGIAEAALTRGLTPLVLAGRDFAGSVAAGRIACQSRFTARYQTSGGGGWPRQALFSMASLLPGGIAGSVAPPIRQLRRQFRRNVAADDPFGRELTATLADIATTERDIVLLHSVSAANLAALCDAPAPSMPGRLLLVLRRTPEDMDGDDPGPRPIASVLRRLRDIYGDRLSISADTCLLSRAFHQATGLPVRAVPPPVAIPDVIAPSPREAATPHLVFIGGARLEKNYHLLPAIVAAVLSRGRGRARFTLHAGRVDAASDPLLQRAHRELHAMSGPDLRLIEHPLPTDAYWTLLNSADLVLLPYNGAIYGPRSSGILVESLALGVPALVPAGCWMEHAGGASRTAVMATAADAPAAVLKALDRLPELTAGARAGQWQWREAHSSNALLAALLEV